MPTKSLGTLRLVLSLLVGLAWLAGTDHIAAAEPAAGNPDKPKQAAKKERLAAKKPAVKPAVRPNLLALQPPKPKSPQEELQQVNVKALRLAIADLRATFGDRYAQAADFLEQVDRCERQKQELEAALGKKDPDAASKVSALLQDFRQLQQDALLANPLLDFDRLLLDPAQHDQPQAGPAAELAGQLRAAEDRLRQRDRRPLAGPARRQADHALPARRTSGSSATWTCTSTPTGCCSRCPAARTAGRSGRSGPTAPGLRQVTPGEEPDVDNYDACYLPDGRIIFCSTRCFHGVPCVGGGNTVANLCIMDADGSGQRQLCFDQDHNWCPTVLNDGRVLYTRWEYSDSPHYFTRLLFHMNPDGTGQMEYYGSNSSWPNSIFYARPIPGHPTKVVAVISGHHGVPRMGELVVFDPALGRREADGAVQRIPGHGVKVEPVIGDEIVDNSWPKFLHPYPLSEKYFLVAMQPDAAVALGHLPGRRVRQPGADQGDAGLRAAGAGAAAQDAAAAGDPGPRRPGQPRGHDLPERHLRRPRAGGRAAGHGQAAADLRAALRLSEDGRPHQHRHRRAVGRPPHPGHGAGRERRLGQLHGAGQHARRRAAAGRTGAGAAAHAELVHGHAGRDRLVRRLPRKPERGAAVAAHVGHAAQAVGDHALVRAGPRLQLRARGPAGAGQVLRRLPRRTPDARGDRGDRPSRRRIAGRSGAWQGQHRFTPSYVALHPYVRRPGPESDYALQIPLEYHASTSELVQMLEKGHYNVKLDAEAWDRLITWIDLNVPDHGTWSEHRAIAQDFHQRRLDDADQVRQSAGRPGGVPDAAAGSGRRSSSRSRCRSRPNA